MPCLKIIILIACAQLNCDNDDVPPPEPLPSTCYTIIMRKTPANLQCVPAWRPPTQPNLREYRRPSYEHTPLCTDVRNNGLNMLVMKFWSSMRMREISGLDSQLVRWPLDDKHGHTLTDLVTQNILLLHFFLLFTFLNT